MNLAWKKTASPPSHALFAANLCAWTNAKLTISGSPFTKPATLTSSKKTVRDERPHLDDRKYDRNNLDLVDMW